MRAFSTGPKTLLFNAALFVLMVLARAPFAILRNFEDGIADCRKNRFRRRAGVLNFPRIFLYEVKRGLSFCRKAVAATDEGIIKCDRIDYQRLRKFTTWRYTVLFTARQSLYHRHPTSLHLRSPGSSIWTLHASRKSSELPLQPLKRRKKWPRRGQESSILSLPFG